MTGAPARSPRRRTGSRAANQAARRDAILDAALAGLRERGVAGTSMLAVATAARTSKETVYRLFGDRQGLFEALVRREAAAMNAGLADALSTDSPPAEVLRRFGRDVLALLLGERSVAINRAAITEAARDPELGRILAAAGRDGTGPLVVAYLEREHAAGRLELPSAQEAFEVLLGLLLSDRQVRTLLGVDAHPTAEQLDARAERAVAYFLRLFGRPGPG